MGPSCWRPFSQTRRAYRPFCELQVSVSIGTWPPWSGATTWIAFRIRRLRDAALNSVFIAWF